MTTITPRSIVFALFNGCIIEYTVSNIHGAKYSCHDIDLPANVVHETIKGMVIRQELKAVCKGTTTDESFGKSKYGNCILNADHQFVINCKAEELNNLLKGDH